MLLAGNDSTDARVDINIDMNETDLWLQDALTFGLNGTVLVQSPMDIAALRAEADRLLEDGRNWSLFSTGEWIGISIGLSVLLLLGLFILFLYCKARLVMSGGGLSSSILTTMEMLQGHRSQKDSDKVPMTPRPTAPNENDIECDSKSVIEKNIVLPP